MTDAATTMTLPPLYAIVDEAAARARGWSVPDLAQAYLDGGARLLQIRASEATGADLLRWCDDVVARATAVQATVIVNDRADVARVAGAGGVHVGQDDLPVPAVRGLMGSGALIGLSTHTPGQLETAVGEAVDYVAVGPVFPTGSKRTGYEAVGLSLVRAGAAVVADRPVVAIGGITLDRAPEVLAAGATSVAVIADLLVDGDPAARVAAYVERLAGSSK